METNSSPRRFFLLLSFLFLLGGLASVAAANTLVVSKEGGQYGSIQSAINSANPGDTVRVREGTYKENLSVVKDLTLKGPGPSKVKLDGKKEGYPVLHVGPSKVEVTVKDLTLQGAEGVSLQAPCKEKEKGLCPDGLAAVGKSKLRVKRVIISGNGNGIRLVHSSRVTVDNSEIRDNGASIFLEGSAQATVQNNSIRKNKVGIKIFEPEKFKGNLEGSGNRIIDNETNFAGVSESTREELVSEPTVKTWGVPHFVTYKGPEFTIKDKEGQILGTGTVSITTSPYWPSNDYKIVDHEVGDVDADGTKEVVLIARHVKWYPGQVYVVEKDGSGISRYWNPGFLYSLKLYDIEDDGDREILVGATNNDKRDNFNVPAVFALDARTMKGEAPPRYGSFGSGAEIWYTFPDLTRGAGIRSLSISEGSLVITTGDGTQYTLRLSDGKVMSSSS